MANGDGLTKGERFALAVWAVFMACGFVWVLLMVLGVA